MVNFFFGFCGFNRLQTLHEALDQPGPTDISHVKTRSAGDQGRRSFQVKHLDQQTLVANVLGQRAWLSWRFLGVFFPSQKTTLRMSDVLKISKNIYPKSFPLYYVLWLGICHIILLLHPSKRLQSFKFKIVMIWKEKQPTNSTNTKQIPPTTKKNPSPLFHANCPP